MKIDWKLDHPEAEFSGRTGTDEAGNVYRENAAREVVGCTTPDGRTGTGWTPEEALREALDAPRPRHVPGPWTATRCHAANLVDVHAGELLKTADGWIVPPGTSLIATVAHVGTVAATDANAALIAAAPDLLDALRDLLEWEIRMGGFESPAWERARLATAKAIGKGIQGADQPPQPVPGEYVRPCPSCGEIEGMGGSLRIERSGDIRCDCCGLIDGGV